jgi:TIR domain
LRIFVAGEHKETPQGGSVARVFFSYSHADEALRDQLEKQLAILKRLGVLETWHDRRIGAGSELAREIDANLEASDVILLLVSSDFLASDYCYDIEMKRALERHDNGDAIVIPVILRSCLWHQAPFGKLLATPRDGKPITQWPDIDQAFTEVADAIRKAAQKIAGPASAPSPSLLKRTQPTAITEAAPRSSNLRLKKEFTDREKDRFQQDTFEYIANFFANSIEELSARNSGIEGECRRIDANRFTASIYRNGKAIARGTVFTGGSFFGGNGISYVHGETTASNSTNETLRVEADDQTLFLTSMGMAMMASRGRDTQKLSQEGAAELYWSMLIEPLQRTG